MKNTFLLVTSSLAFAGSVYLFLISDKLRSYVTVSREVALASDGKRFGGAKPYNSMSKKT